MRASYAISTSRIQRRLGSIINGRDLLTLRILGEESEKDVVGGSPLKFHEQLSRQRLVKKIESIDPSSIVLLLFVVLPPFLLPALRHLTEAAILCHFVS